MYLCIAAWWVYVCWCVLLYFYLCEDLLKFASEDFSLKVEHFVSTSLLQMAVYGVIAAFTWCWQNGTGKPPDMLTWACSCSVPAMVGPLSDGHEPCKKKHGPLFHLNGACASWTWLILFCNTLASFLLDCNVIWKLFFLQFTLPLLWRKIWSFSRI